MYELYDKERTGYTSPVDHELQLLEYLHYSLAPDKTNCISRGGHSRKSLIKNAEAPPH